MVGPTITLIIMPTIASSAVVEATVNYLNVCLIDLPELEPMSSAPTGTVAECPDDFDFWVQLLQAEMEVTQV